MDTILFIAILTVAALFMAAGILWLFGNHGLDKMIHPEEWSDTGKSGERIVYNTLLSQFHIPEKYILRNVYVPTKDGGTTEIDILVVSRKGLLVFECKNYAGKIYGDAQKQKWIQYLGNKRSYFYNPFMQNRGHVNSLRIFLSGYDVPIIPFLVTVTRGNWKVKHFGAEDYLLGYNCHLKEILNEREDSDSMLQHVDGILKKLQPLSRPGKETHDAHIARVSHKNAKIKRWKFSMGPDRNQ